MSLSVSVPPHSPLVTVPGKEHHVSERWSSPGGVKPVAPGVPRSGQMPTQGAIRDLCSGRVSRGARGGTWGNVPH